MDGRDEVVPDLLPARMLNEFVYCPRLAYMEWVEAEFADNIYTEEGRWQHRRVDAEAGQVPAPSELEDGEELLKIRGVKLSSPAEGLIAGIDMVELREETAAPVDYKRGSTPAGGVYEPERVQLCAQGLVLRDNGWTVEGGWIYFVESRERVWVEFDDELVARTREAAAGMRAMAEGGVRPPPLVRSVKCDGCSLTGICLPDEVNFLGLLGRIDAEEGGLRQLLTPRDDALPLYVQQQGLTVGLSGEVLQIREKGKMLSEARLIDVSQINLLGNVQITTQAVRELCRRGIPVCYFSNGGHFFGILSGTTHKNVILRQKQYRSAFDDAACLEIARALVGAKILNCRTLLMRNHRELSEGRRLELARYGRAALVGESLQSLLGLEGMAARVYFAEFSGMLKQTGLQFDFDGRNRRPPRDPINALLSFAYSMLAKELTVIAQAVGFDPFQGFYHQVRYGRPALALDLMEPFRPLIADSAVIWAVNNGVITASDFRTTGLAAALTPRGRRAFIEALERRLDESVTHPLFGYRLSYRRLLEVQTRLVSRYLDGELKEFPTFRTR